MNTQTPVDISSRIALDLASWRCKATNAYTIAVAMLHLPVVLLFLFRGPLDTFPAVMTILAWGLILAAAGLRRLPVKVRVSFLVGAVWCYAAAMLMRSGVFASFRVSMLSTPIAMMLLAGVRFGLVVGGIQVVMVILAFRATDLGLLISAPGPWADGEWMMQSAVSLAIAFPQLLILAWFSHHLTTWIRRQTITSERLKAEAAERERLEDEVQRAGEQEQLRIGSELHDGVCQDLTGLLLRTKRIQRTLESRGAGEAELISPIMEGLGEAIGELHSLSRRLSPGHLSQGDLAGALRDLMLRSGETAEAELVFTTHGDGPNPGPEQALHLFRIAQEALANAMRHSGANRIEIHLEHGMEVTRITIRDNGRGMPPESIQPQGLGLNTMRWRAAKLKGTLSLEPASGGGTRVICEVPAKMLRDMDEV